MRLVIEMLQVKGHAAERARRINRMLVPALAGVVAWPLMALDAAADVLFNPPPIAPRQFLPDPDSLGAHGAAMDVDASEASIVFDSLQQRVVRLAADGTFLDQWPAAAGTQAVLAVDGADRVYIHDRAANVVRVYDTVGTPLTQWAVGVGYLYSLDVTSDGVVLGVDGSTVHAFSGDGTPRAPWPNVGLDIRDIATDGSDVWIFGVSDQGAQVQRRSAKGDLLSDFRVEPHNGLLVVGGDRVWILAFTPDSIDPTSFTPWVYSRSGILLAHWNHSVELDPYVFTGASAFAADGTGNLRVLEYYGDDPWRIEVSAVVAHEPLAPGVIVTADPPVTPYRVDGVEYVGTQLFPWTPGSSHVLGGLVAPETSPGTRQAFVSWSDGGDRVHTVAGPASADGILLTAQTEHFVEVLADSGGTASGGGWAAAGTEVAHLATPASGYRFVKWSEGPADGAWHDTDRFMPWFAHTVSGPETWEACFVRQGLVLTISASGTDPWVNAASPTFGPRQLFLWGACLDRGISALEADVATSMQAFPFEPAGGGLNSGGGADLFLAIPDCPIGAEANVLLGSWWVIDNGGDFCLQPSAANGILGIVDCPATEPRIATPSVVGFSSIGEPCRVGPPCGESVDEGVTAAPELQAASGPVATLHFAARGNPFRDHVDLSLELPFAGRASLRIYDVTGRLVRSLRDGALPAGHHALTWDGRNAANTASPAGVYFARLETPGAQRTLKLVRLP